MILVDQFGDQLFRFSGCGAVADRNDLDIVFSDHIEQLRFGTRNIAVFSERIDLVYRQHLACGIQYRQLAAVIEARVETQDDSALQRSLGQ